MTEALKLILFTVMHNMQRLRITIKEIERLRQPAAKYLFHPIPASISKINY
jgi:hypothetical protein